MLGNRNKSNQAAPAADTTSLIANGTHVRGDVVFSGRLHVDGSVEGALHGESDNAVLTLSNSASIKGEIVAPHVVINGQVNGDVTATQRLELAAGARVEGNVYYKVMEMSAGAQINGKIVHRADPPKQLAAPEDAGENADAFTLSGAAQT
ncbi:MAG: polymer-forming cytoskeletal protein [Rudaea sp.]|uniref:bactofilin family protein n=1 Tax=Rudaea sp. TaxID=2136325 RepID=UPI0039E2A293